MLVVSNTPIAATALSLGKKTNEHFIEINEVQYFGVKVCINNRSLVQIFDGSYQAYDITSGDAVLLPYGTIVNCEPPTGMASSLWLEEMVESDSDSESDEYEE